MSRGNRPVVVAYSYYKDYIGSFFAFLQHLVADLDASHLVVLTNESTFHAASEVLQRYPISCFSTVLLHTNDGWEFGAYQMGFDYIRSTDMDPSAAVIVNDTVSHHYTLTRRIYRRFIEKVLLSAREDQSVLIGEFQSPREPLSVRGDDIPAWARSCFLGLNWKCVKAIDYKIYDPSILDDIYIENGLIRAHRGLFSPSMELYLNRWLGLVEGSGPKWYGANDGRGEEFLRKKAASILNEKCLSAKVWLVGGKFAGIVPESIVENFVFRSERWLTRKLFPRRAIR